MSIFHMFYDRQGNPIEFLQLAELLEDPNVHRVSKTHSKTDHGYRQYLQECSYTKTGFAYSRQCFSLLRVVLRR